MRTRNRLEKERLKKEGQTQVIEKGRWRQEKQTQANKGGG
jgi:hypothetical protein